MPLVFAVLIILVIYFNSKDSAKRNAKRESLHADHLRKTNARLEQSVMNAYMMHGYSADEAFKKSYEDMIAAGYEPCIPRNAYQLNSSKCSKIISDSEITRFDSYWVRQRKEAVIKEWCKNHPGQYPHEAPLDKLEAMVYDRFPTNENEYVHDIKRLSNRSRAASVGTFIIYPGFGTCEVLGHNWIGDGALGGTYTLRVLKTGEIVTHIKIGDDKIRKQGQ